MSEATSTAPGLSQPSSSRLPPTAGGFTLSTTSAPPSSAAGSVDELGAGVAVGLIGEARGDPRARLDRHLVSGLDEFLAGLGTSATRRSMGAVSAGTAMRIGPLCCVSGPPNLSEPAASARGRLSLVKKS